jgi:hypothetical protein
MNSRGGSGSPQPTERATFFIRVRSEFPGPPADVHCFGAKGELPGPHPTPLGTGAARGWRAERGMRTRGARRRGGRRWRLGRRRYPGGRRLGLPGVACGWLDVGALAEARRHRSIVDMHALGRAWVGRDLEGRARCARNRRRARGPRPAARPTDHRPLEAAFAECCRKAVEWKSARYPARRTLIPPSRRRGRSTRRPRRRSESRHPPRAEPVRTPSQVPDQLRTRSRIGPSP